jgi:hypothetical protein
LFDEARRLSPESNWLISAYQQRWDEAIALTRENLDGDSESNGAKLILANFLHMSGDLAGAQSIYQELALINPGFPIIDLQTTSPMATARMAFGAKVAGDVNASVEALRLLQADQRQRQEVGVRESYMLRGAAMAAAIEGDAEHLVANLEAAIDVGLRDHFIFREPAFAPYLEHPEFKAQAARLETILEDERFKTIQLVCLDNPTPEAWEPLPETCEYLSGSRDLGSE